MSQRSKARISSRVMPIKEVITRFKSAQLKRQIKDTSIPKEIPIKRRKINNSPKIKLSKPKIVENNEYYPDRKRNKVQVKKIVLLPKHDYKVIGKSNRRKLNVPRKEAKRRYSDSLSSTDSPKHISKEHTISEMIQLIEDTGNLDDEDLLEILTCPSPVWWEDPPDGYHEEPIIINSANESTKVTEEFSEENVDKENVRTGKNNDCLRQESLDIKVKISDPNIIKKRGKLESLLGAIKAKTNKKEKEKIDLKTDKKTDILNAPLDDAMLDNLENMVIPIEDENECDKSPDVEIVKIDEKPALKCNKNDFNLKIDNSDTHQTINEIDKKIDIASSCALKYLEKDASDFITVYKIINSDTDDIVDQTDKKEFNESNEKIGKINSYFKTCKNFKRSSKKSLDSDEYSNSSAR